MQTAPMTAMFNGSSAAPKPVQAAGSQAQAADFSPTLQAAQRKAEKTSDLAGAGMVNQSTVAAASADKAEGQASVAAAADDATQAVASAPAQGGAQTETPVAAEQLNTVVAAQAPLTAEQEGLLAINAGVEEPVMAPITAAVTAATGASASDEGKEPLLPVAADATETAGDKVTTRRTEQRLTAGGDSAVAASAQTLAAQTAAAQQGAGSGAPRQDAAPVLAASAEAGVNADIQADVVTQPINPQELARLVEQGAQQTIAPKDKISDPRFAALLARPQASESLRQQQTIAVATGAGNSGATAGGVDPFSAFGEKPDSSSSLTPLAAGDALSTTMSEPAALLSELVARSGQPSQTETGQIVLAQNGSVQPGSTSPAQSPLPLSNGVSVPESHVVEQTIEHLSLFTRGDSSTITVKLHPEELGELQLRMVMEGDQLKVHLQAQNQQVQEVLERHFPRLRDALQDMGLSVEDFQVSVDGGDRGQQQSSSQREFTASQGGRFQNLNSELNGDFMAEILPTVPAAAMTGGRSISVRI